MQFTFVSLLLCTPLVLAFPAPLAPRDHQFRDSKKVPVLKSGNALMTSRYNVVYKEDEPDWHMTPEGKEALGDDTNRGFVRILHKDTTDTSSPLVAWGTIQVFLMPEIAQGKKCGYYFFFGPGDAAGGFSRLQLYSLVQPTEVWEFNTTYNNRPDRSDPLGTFAIYPPKWLTDKNPVPDVVADVPDNSNVPAVIEEWTGTTYQRIELDCPVGKVAYDLLGVATDPNGILPPMAWSLNKGLAIEILGVPQDEVPLWDPHTSTELDG